jgi:hypothetical protein
MIEIDPDGTYSMPLNVTYRRMWRAACIIILREMEEETMHLYWMNDQPTTCPYCGARTEYHDLIHQGVVYEINFCLNKEHCGFVFAAVED